MLISSRCVPYSRTSKCEIQRKLMLTSSLQHGKKIILGIKVYTRKKALKQYLKGQNFWEINKKCVRKILVIDGETYVRLI